MSIEEINPESLNFQTCKFRSEEKIDRVIQRCACQGGNYTISAYVCNERGIFEVTPEICKECTVYQSK